MKKVFKNAALIAASLLLTMGVSSCNKTDETTDEANIETKDAIIKQYLNHTVYPTYGQLAANTETLVDDLKTLPRSPPLVGDERSLPLWCSFRFWH